jgi:nucleoside-diphosphate-sugar epimerase
VNSEKLLPLSVLILGCGDLGQRLAARLPADQYRVVGVRRSPAVDTPSITYRQCDLSQPDALRPLLTEPVGVIVITMTPDERSDAGYRRAYVDTCRHLVANLKTLHQTPRLLVFVSSTGVYGQQDGSWVDETSPTEPDSFSGQRLLEAEAIIRESDFPHCIVRFSGIYGPGRTRLIEQVRQGRAVLSAAFTNRIHADDCAGVLAHLIDKARRGLEQDSLYLATDSTPAPMAEVVNWLAMQLKVDRAVFAPDRIDSERGNKRCANQRLLESGYRLRYPGYQQGYAALLGLPDTATNAP